MNTNVANQGILYVRNGFGDNIKRLLRVAISFGEG
jgi:hypothetical protein